MLIQNREHFGFGRSEFWACGLAEFGLGKFVELFWCFEILFVRVVVFVFAFICGILTTDLRSRVVGATPVIFQEMFANRMNQQVPDALVDEKRGLAMQQVPSHEFEVLHGMGVINGQGEISTAFGRAKIAKAFTWFEVVAMWLDGGHSIHG